ncbi:MAG: L,D-transpeptidase [uncultured Sulfurovum sp.]|uniref:L,D-transpeptidase n=1 Tax=uncultured Sulfurovum sp. TaxID=269237 RepID=A0A6S6SXT2_9BACT|nr:MAG: L,D-transpeptidase [uncultured Sulfurovum sp.]
MLQQREQNTVTRILPIIVLVSTLSLGHKQIEVDLSKQRLYAKENGNIFMDTKISSGKKGHRTPRGKFSIFLKSKSHISSKYPKRVNGQNGGAKMPHSLFITKGGVAIHGGYIPKYPASHGCIRISPEKASKLYEWANIGTKVRVTGKAVGGHYAGNKYRKRYKKKVTKNKSSESPKIVKEYYDRYTNWTDNYYDPKNTTLIADGKEFDYLYD